MVVEFHEDHVATICPIAFCYSVSLLLSESVSGCPSATAGRAEFQWCTLHFSHFGGKKLQSIFLKDKNAVSMKK